MDTEKEDSSQVTSGLPTDDGYNSDLTLSSRILGRQAQIKLLLSLMGERHHMTTGSIFLYGHTCTGKSYVLQSLLSHYQLPHILINCVECSSPRFLFEHIINNLPLNPRQDSDSEDTGAKNDQYDDGPEDFISCEDMTSFVRMLVNKVSESQLRKQTLYIVLDKAERLRDADSKILPAMLRLQELTGLNICTILISEIVWEKFRAGTGFCEPYILHFPDYTQKELADIMCLDAPSSCDRDVYSLYVSIVLSVFHMVCCNLRELRHLARLNLPYFLEPLESGEAQPSHTTKLWRNIEPHLKKALKSVYLREVSSRQWEAMQQAQIDDPDSDLSKANLSSRCYVELPYYSKFLLIAAYLASYNPMKYDRRFFAKYAGRISKRSKLAKKNERASNHLLGPKVFPVDRLMAIFYAIVEGKVVPSAYVYVQISSLVSLHLLKQVGGDDKISAPKYKCVVTLDFVRSVARTVQFDVMRYLYDFL